MVHYISSNSLYSIAMEVVLLFSILGLLTLINVVQSVSGSDDLCVSNAEGGGGAIGLGWWTWDCLGVEDISVWWVKFGIEVDVKDSFWVFYNPSKTVKSLPSNLEIWEADFTIVDICPQCLMNSQSSTIVPINKINPPTTKHARIALSGIAKGYLLSIKVFFKFFHGQGG